MSRVAIILAVAALTATQASATSYTLRVHRTVASGTATTGDPNHCLAGCGRGVLISGTCKAYPGKTGAEAPLVEFGRFDDRNWHCRWQNLPDVAPEDYPVYNCRAICIRLESTGP